MIYGLTDACDGFVTYIQQHDPLPNFSTTQSWLELEESTMSSVPLVTPALPLLRPLSWPKPLQLNPCPHNHHLLPTQHHPIPTIVVTKARKTTAATTTMGGETADNNNNSGSNGISHLENNGVLGITYRVLTSVGCFQCKHS
jgi:hypothetical protein